MRLLIPILLKLMVIDYAFGAAKEIRWTYGMKSELLRIYYTNAPNEMMFHADRMKAKWDREFPEYRNSITGEELRQYALKLIKSICDYETDVSLRMPQGFNENVLRIYYQTEKGEKYHGNRMNAMWDQEFPYFTAWYKRTDLRAHALALISRLRDGKRDRKPNFPWTSKFDKVVLDIYNAIPPKTVKRYDKMKALWDEKCPQFKNDITGRNLNLRAQKLLKEIDNSKGNKKDAELQIKKVFPDDSNYKGKTILEVTNEPTSSYPVHHSEPGISQFYSDDPIYSPVLHQELLNDSDVYHHMAGSGQWTTQPFPNMTNYMGHHYEYGGSSQSQDLHHSQTHFDDPIYSPARHQEFLNEFDMHHQITNSSQWPQHLPNLTHYKGHHRQHGNSSRSRDKHHPN